MEQNQGVTASERYLAKLCKGTFLDLWSYPNPYRHQKAFPGDAQGKELCDLLVVFGSNVIIFSDKSCKINKTENPQNDWNRWKKRAVEKSARQLFGAERWIRQNPHLIFSDAECTKRIPLTVDSNKLRIHRVVVAVGAKKLCQQFYGSGTGSLIIEGGQRDAGPQDTQLRFAVGQPNPRKGFVHILDEFSLDVVLKELDTITDLVEYLEKKERFFQSYDYIVACGEEELLAYYMTNFDKERGGYGFYFPSNMTDISLAEGFWADYVNNPQAVERRKQNQISYGWDEIINDFTQHFRKGTLFLDSGRSRDDYERVLRIMASENRTCRRMLSRGLYELVRKPLRGVANNRCALSFADPTVAYVFVSYVPRSIETDETEYRNARLEWLRCYCTVFGAKDPNIQQVVGLATEQGVDREFRSFDNCFIDFRHQRELLEEDARRIQAVLGICQDENMKKIHEYDRDFPIVTDVRALLKQRRRKLRLKKHALRQNHVADKSAQSDGETRRSRRRKRRSR